MVLMIGQKIQATGTKILTIINKIQSFKSTTLDGKIVVSCYFEAKCLHQYQSVLYFLYVCVLFVCTVATFLIEAGVVIQHHRVNVCVCVIQYKIVMEILIKN